MRPKHKIAASAITALIGVAVTVILFWPLQREPGPKHPPMRIGTLYWPGTYWIDIARAKGWFAEADLPVEFVDANADYYAAMDAIEKGTLDTLTVWLFDIVKHNQDGVNLVMVLATDESNGSEALIGGAHIESVQQLQGRRIGVPLGTALVYELDVILSRFGMSLKDVTLVDIEGEKAGDRLAEGKVDAVMTWEPHAGNIVAAGGINLYDSSKLPGVIMAGMVFREEFIQLRPEDVQRMLNVWHRATAYLQSHPKEAFAIVAEGNNVTPEAVALFTERDRIMGLQDNIVAFTYASGLESLFGSARKINRFLLKQNADAEPVDTTEFLNGKFVKELAREKADR